MIDEKSLEALASMLMDASEDCFTGNIQVNFFKGSISNIIKQQSFKMEDLLK